MGKSMEESNQNAVIEAFRGYLRREGENLYEEDEDGKGFMLIFETGGEDTPSYLVHIRVCDDFFRIAARLPDEVPKEKRKEMAYFLNRLNASSMCGNWEMAPENGALCLRYSAFLLGDVPSLDEFWEHVRDATTYHDEEYARIHAVLSGEKSMKEECDETWKEDA